MFGTLKIQFTHLLSLVVLVSSALLRSSLGTEHSSLSTNPSIVILSRSWLLLESIPGINL